MATSSSTNFELDVTEYIEEAYERCGLEMRTGYDASILWTPPHKCIADYPSRQAPLPKPENINYYEFVRV